MMNVQSTYSRRIYAACFSDRGRVRRNNEDNYLFHGEHMGAGSEGPAGILCTEYDLSQLSSGSDIFFAVFDGVGGAQYGDQASMIAASSAGHFLDTYEWAADDPGAFLEELYRNMNQAVLQGRESLYASEMCTTAVSLLMHGNSVWCSNAGDSRCYMFKDGELLQISTDHNNAQAFMALGITGVKPMLTQYLGMDPAELEFAPAHAEFPVEPGEVFLLCSDGLTDMVTEQHISDILAETPDPELAVEALVTASLESGGKDNITVIVIRIE